MYAAAHKLVGASFYAGVMRVGTIADKMQKACPKDSPNPNFKRYKALYDILTVETQVAFDDYDKYKYPNAPPKQATGNPPAAQQRPIIPAGKRWFLNDQ
jgi:hypothetical protein